MLNFRFRIGAAAAAFVYRQMLYFSLGLNVFPATWRRRRKSGIRFYVYPWDNVLLGGGGALHLIDLLILYCFELLVSSVYIIVGSFYVRLRNILGDVTVLSKSLRELCLPSFTPLKDLCTQFRRTKTRAHDSYLIKYHWVNNVSSMCNNEEK